MSTTLNAIPSRHVATVWPLVEKPIAAALAYSGERYGPDDIRRALIDGRMQLWIAWDAGAKAVRACAVTMLIPYPRLNVCAVVLLTGSGRRTWQHHLDALRRWARAQGCGAFEAWARPGWERVFKGKLRRTHVLLECRL